MKEKFVVLDVEGMSTARPYNVGYIVADRYGTIYKKRSFVFPVCFWENLQKCINVETTNKMTHKNIETMLQDTKNKKKNQKYQWVNILEFYNIFIKELKKYNVKKIYAYNVTFDKNAIKRLVGPALFDMLDVQWLDIMTAAVKTKLLTKKYVDFCKKYNYITEKGNYRYTAEIVYRYLFNDLIFKEEHTGLADVLVEYEILLTIFKSHKKMDFTPCQAWRFFNQLTK